MLLTISDILDDATRRQIAAAAAALSWRDGRITAGNTAKTVKQNEQADLSSPEGRALATLALDAISSHAVVGAAARPRRFSNLLLSRMTPDDRYGPHVDNALMRKNGDRFRSDISFTLFLTPPDEYDGGELVIHRAGSAQSVKGDAGDLVLYASTSIHEVATVTRGERLVCVGWIESLIPDEAQRELLFDLENLRVSLRASMDAQSAELLTVDKTIANLLRMWAHP
ncbi:MAG: Fe2+-dependent dioxygenase [Pseudomonadota bacterium]